jgi:hypothetical protein
MYAFVTDFLGVFILLHSQYLKTIQQQTEGRLMNNELERIWKKATTA